MRTVTRVPRICPIATPLLVVTTSLEESAGSTAVFGVVPQVCVLGVFGTGLPAPADVIDLRDTAPIALQRTPGERTKTREIAAQIADAVERVGAATVAIGLGLRGGDQQEASDAALLARRNARKRIAWIMYLEGRADAESERDAGRIARRRMQLAMRGVRLEPVAVAEAPMGSTARFWEVRASRDY